MLFLGLTGISVSYWGPLHTLLPYFVLYLHFYLEQVQNLPQMILKVLTVCTLLHFIIYHSNIYVSTMGKSNFYGYFYSHYQIILDLVGEFLDVIKPAFTALAWYLPIVTVMPAFKNVYRFC